MIQWIVSSSLLILIMIGLRYLLRGRVKPSLQYALWALVLVRLLIPFQFGSAPISIENTVAQAPIVQEIQQAERVEHLEYHLDGFATGYYTFTPDLEQTPDTEQNEPVTERFTHAEADRITQLRSAKEYLEWAWIAGMAIMGVVFLVSNLVFALRLRKSRKLQEKGKLPVYVTEAVETPCLFGLFRPAIYLTPAVAREAHHREYAVAHETTHYRHGDYIWSVLRCVCLVVHWYNPLVWWAAVLSRADGEIACDEATISTLGENQRAEYGHVLIDLTCRKTTDLLRTATTMTGSAKGLKERIKMIAKRPKMAIYTLIAVLLVAAITVGCTFTGASQTKDATDDPTQETTEPTKPTDPSKIEEKLPDTIQGTPLTEEELADFTQMFTRTGEEDNWYNILLACEFSRPEDINVRHLFNNGFYPQVEITSVDEGFLNTLSWYQPNAGPVEKLPIDQMEDVLKNYLGVSLRDVNRHGLESLDLFANNRCYFVAPAGAIGMRDFTMIDGKREADGTVWLMSRQGSGASGKGSETQELRIVCLKPQPDNQTAPYRVQSCQWLVYVGFPYPREIDPNDCVPYMYTGEPVIINGKEMVGDHKENYLYVYRHSRGWSEQIGWAPIHSFTTDDNGHIYFVVQDQSQIIRCNYAGQQMQVAYATNEQIKSVSYEGNNRIRVEDGKRSVVYNTTTGRKESEKHPDLSKVEFLKDVTGTPLTEDELAYFTELFSHKGTVEKEEDINWYNILLDCGWDFTDAVGFTVPENVNMRRLFNNGFREVSYTSNWTAEELAFVQSFQPGYPENSKDFFRLPVDRMNKVLQDYLGITLEQSNKVWLDTMKYFADTNCYFSSPAGAVGARNVKMTDGKRAADGTVYLICSTDSSQYLRGRLLLAVTPAPEGAARPYWVQMCTEVDEVADVAAAIQMAVRLPAKTPEGSNEHDSKFFMFHNRPNSEVVDRGYDGKPYTLEGLEEYFLYAIDDGVVYSVSGGPVKEWAISVGYEHIYFVLEDDAGKIWRTDRHGQDRTLVYESKNGDVTFLSYHYDGHHWLYLVENSNRCILFDMTEKKAIVVLTPYYVSQFSYDIEEMRIFWEGKLNESDPEKPAGWYLGDYRYYYYPQTNEYKVLKADPKTGGMIWATVTPEQ